MKLAARPFTFALAALVLFAPHTAVAQEVDVHREADAHVHGTIELVLVLEGSKLSVELSSPLWNLVGFEHAPASEKDRAAWRSAVASLSDPARVITFPDTSGCRPVGKSLGVFASPTPATQAEKSGANEAGHHDEHDHGEEQNAHSGDRHHGDFHDALLSWTFTCTRSASLASGTLVVFKSFPNITKATVAVIAGGKQSAATLTPDSPLIRIR